jgi:hypothetical protein
MAPDVGTPIEAGSPGAVDITFEVHADENVHPISPYVYGLNDGSGAAATHATIVRSGGNRLTAYNWENNASNAGSDWQFENDDYLCSGAKCLPSNDAPGAYIKAVLDQATAAGAAALVTVPIVDYVAADKSPGGDVRGSADYLQTRFRQNKAAKGAPFANPPDATDAFVYQDEFVSWLAATAPAATVRFLLDNEPDLWSATHAEVHKAPVTYAELAQRSVAYAKAIKAVMPGAEIWGPVSYGWNGYVNLQNAPDAQADGDFLDWWLDQMKAAEASSGGRLVAGMDLHWYPEATDTSGARIVTSQSTPSLVAAREQAPRSLWDASYTESSWITKYSTMGPINLIARVQQKIAQHYPGTKLSFSEWDYGGDGDVSGAIASADVLGIFGAYGVDMAMYWPGGDSSFTLGAFKAYRNYDGNGAAFGDTSVLATTTDVPSSSAYASLRSSDASRLVLVVINKASTDKLAGIRVFHSTSYTKASVFAVTQAGGASPVAASPISAVATNAFQYRMPAQSVSVIVPAP